MRPTRWPGCLRYSPSGLPSGLRFLQNRYRLHSMLFRKSYASSRRLCCLSGGWTEKSPNLESDGLELSRLRPDTTEMGHRQPLRSVSAKVAAWSLWADGRRHTDGRNRSELRRVEGASLTTG